MQIRGLQKLTLQGCPGVLSCAVFLAGCNFRCPWCSSPQFVLPLEIKKLPLIKKRQFFQFLKSQQGVLQGVVLTGGEPCLEPDLPKFCSGIKALGYKIKLETNGSQPDVLKKLASQRLVDYIALDIKGPKEKYPALIGLDECSCLYLVEKIEQSIDFLKKGLVDYQFCLTFHSLLAKNDIWHIVQWLGQADKLSLKPFRSEKTLDPNFTILEAVSNNDFLKAKQALAPFTDSRS